MKNIFLDRKIKQTLVKFKKFKETFDFKLKTIDTTQDGSMYVDGLCIRQGLDGEVVSETENFVNVGYKNSGAMPKVLSNLFPYEFVFKGNKVCSVESVFQALKFKDKKSQKQVFKLSGLNANRIKVATDYDWKQTQTLYFLGDPMKRDSKKYQDFIDELYVSLLMNPLFVGTLKSVGGKYILHSIGEEDKTKTTFSRQEFEFELNCLKEFVQKNF